MSIFNEMKIEHMGSEIDMTRRDIYLCEFCSHRVQKELRLSEETFEERPLPMLYHKRDSDMDGQEHPDFYPEFLFGQQIEVLEYDNRIAVELGEAMRSFIEQRYFEKSMGIRDPRVPLYVINNPDFDTQLTFTEIAKRSDITDNAQFPEGIEELIQAHRKVFNFPMALLDVPYAPDKTFRDSINQTELFALCIYMNNEIVGSGSQLFAGRLADQFTEQEVEDQWNKKS